MGTYCSRLLYISKVLFVFFFFCSKKKLKRRICRVKRSWKTRRRTKPTTLAGDDEVVHVQKANRGQDPEPEANAAERNRGADPRARSAENRGADQDVAPLSGPSPSAAVAGPDAARRPKEEKDQNSRVAAAGADAARRPKEEKDPNPSVAAASPAAAPRPREEKGPSPKAAAASPDAVP